MSLKAPEKENTYSLTFEGKPFVTLKTKQKISPGDAEIMMMNALFKKLFFDDESASGEVLEYEEAD